MSIYKKSSITLFRIKRQLFPRLVNNKDFNKYLNFCGIKIGSHNKFYNPGLSSIDVTRPCLLEIGSYCKITEGVIILTHDYSRSVLRRVYGEILGEGKKTIIGDNVFIGINSIILMGTKIGDNVIVGAGSVVTGVVPSNVVIAGNPARVIRSLEEQYQIRRNKTLIEAQDYVRLFKLKYNRLPKIHEMDPFFSLFLKRDIAEINLNKLNINLGGDDIDDVLKDFLKTIPTFRSYSEFIDSCKLENEVPR